MYMSTRGTKKRKRSPASDTAVLRELHERNKRLVKRIERERKIKDIQLQIINGQVPIDPLLHDVLSGPTGEFYRNALNRNIARVEPSDVFKDDDDDDIIMGSRDDEKEKTDEELASTALGEGGLGFHNLGSDRVISKKGGGRRRKRKSRRKKKTRRKRGRKRRRTRRHRH